MLEFIGTWLLPIFFFLAGKELQVEVLHGTFKKKRDLFIPAIAASFGVLLPFLIYKLFVFFTHISTSGWGLVVATDLPLALIALRFFNLSLRSKLKPYLLSLAIFDDLIAILLIAAIYHQNGIHPTVIGFLIGAVFPFSVHGKIEKLLNSLINFIVLPLYVGLFFIENFTFRVGTLTLAVIISRMAGKPIGIYLGDLIARKIFRSQILDLREIAVIGAFGSLGLSVSLLFAQISGATEIAIFSIFATIPFALVRLKVLSRAFGKAES